MSVPNPWGRSTLTSRSLDRRIRKDSEEQYIIPPRPNDQTNPELGAAEAAKDELRCWKGSGGYNSSALRAAAKEIKNQT